MRFLAICRKYHSLEYCLVIPTRISHHFKSKLFIGYLRRFLGDSPLPFTITLNGLYRAMFYWEKPWWQSRQPCGRTHCDQLAVFLDFIFHIPTGGIQWANACDVCETLRAYVCGFLSLGRVSSWAARLRRMTVGTGNIGSLDMDLNYS